MISFIALGVPSPQGSMRAVTTKQGVRMITASTARLRLWRTVVADAARVARGDQPPFEGPVEVTARFVMPRPKSAKKMQRWHAKRPDIDKLTRALLDSLTDAGVFTDDAQVAELAIRKLLADPADPWTGAMVAIRPLLDKHIVYRADVAA